ncbi:MAG TPA: PEP-utilizing enzyme, partial [Anaerolineales bacterium]|nr:PEP-utilizing enzyme [Anaerolineales bacterium]
SAHEFHASDAGTLARRYRSGSLPFTAQHAIQRFLTQYGMRGVGEIDFGQPRWREDPTAIMHTLQSYLDIDETSAPDALFAKGEQAAHNAIEKLAVEARKQSGPFGWLKEKLVRGAARRVRLLMGARESPKFFAIRIMGIGRQALLEAGEEFVAAGTIERAEDLGFLKLNELEALARNEPHDWRSLVAERRAIFERELRRRQVPRILVSDGRAFYEGLGSETDTGNVITGSPVSPGIAEGTVHVVFDPRVTHLAPGEILVCPGTDPAWTPLFMAAGGLITEVGGMMTHGSVVAREYGIPAVVGVHQATTRLKDGQRIRIDGTTGKVIVLE